jgi:hypothetical protein
VAVPLPFSESELRLLRVLLKRKDKLTIPVLRDAMAVTQLVKQRAKRKYKWTDK